MRVLRVAAALLSAVVVLITLACGGDGRDDTGGSPDDYRREVGEISLARDSALRARISVLDYFKIVRV